MKKLVTISFPIEVDDNESNNKYKEFVRSLLETALEGSPPSSSSKEESKKEGEMADKIWEGFQTSGTISVSDVVE